MKTLTWPTTTSSTTTKLYAMAHHINLLNTPINNSKPRHGHATIEGGRSPSYPLAEPESSGHATMYESDCECECEYSYEHWILAPKCWVNYEALFDFGFGFAFGASLRVATGPPWAELFVVHQNQTIHTNIELSRQSSMKLYGSLAFDLCAAAEKGKKPKRYGSRMI